MHYLCLVWRLTAYPDPSVPNSAINPATEEEICKVVAGSLPRISRNSHKLTVPCPLASEKDIDAAVKAARVAFKTTWGKNVTGFERSRLLNKLADLIERDQQERSWSLVSRVLGSLIPFTKQSPSLRL